MGPASRKVLVSLELAAVGFVLIPLMGQNVHPNRASSIRPTSETAAAPTGWRGAAHGPGHLVWRPRGSARRASDDDSAGDVYDSLTDCSPFVSFDGSKELDFDVVRGLVALSDDAGGAQVPAAAAAPTSVGSFAADQRTQQVVVRVAGERRRYVLLTPSDGGQCILAAGASSAADLRRSWFGAPEEDPTLSVDRGDKDQPAPVSQRRSARISPSRSALSKS
jgi:hypothetical protein